MQCANCQHQLLDTAKFCSNCGTPVARQPTELQTTQQVGTVEGAVTGTLLSGTPPSGLRSSTEQTVDTVAPGGTMVGTVLGAKDSPVHVGGQQHYGDTVQGDKTSGDAISVGNVTDSSGVAIGRGAQSTVRQVTTGGDYAEGSLDQRQGAFVSGGMVHGSVVGTNTGTLTSSYGMMPPTAARMNVATDIETALRATDLPADQSKHVPRLATLLAAGIADTSSTADLTRRLASEQDLIPVLHALEGKQLPLNENMIVWLKKGQIELWQRSEQQRDVSSGGKVSIAGGETKGPVVGFNQGSVLAEYHTHHYRPFPAVVLWGIVLWFIAWNIAWAINTPLSNLTGTGGAGVVMSGVISGLIGWLVVGYRLDTGPESVRQKRVVWNALTAVVGFVFFFVIGARFNVGGGWIGLMLLGWGLGALVSDMLLRRLLPVTTSR